MMAADMAWKARSTEEEQVEWLLRAGRLALPSHAWKLLETVEADRRATDVGLQESEQSHPTTTAPQTSDGLGARTSGWVKFTILVSVTAALVIGLFASSQGLPPSVSIFIGLASGLAMGLYLTFRNPALFHRRLVSLIVISLITDVGFAGFVAGNSGGIEAAQLEVGKALGNVHVVSLAIVAIVLLLLDQRSS